MRSSGWWACHLPGAPGSRLQPSPIAPESLDVVVTTSDNGDMTTTPTSTICSVCFAAIRKVVEPHVIYWEDDEGDSLRYVPVLHDHRPIGLRRQAEVSYVYKFDSPFTCYLYSLDGGADDETGDVQFGDGWYGRYGKHIVREDSQGYVSRERFITETAAKVAFAAIEEAMVGDDEGVMA